MGSHRVPVRGTKLRRYEDPARSADPRIRELVAQLRTLEAGPAPRAHFRAELRAQLVAVTPRLVEEGPATETLGADTHPTAARHGLGRLAPVSLARPLAVVASVLVVFAMLLGGAVWISNKALPGDPLYALKRANENVQLSLTHGSQRAKTYLAYASNRADEVKSLLSHASAMATGEGPNAAAAVKASTDKLIRSTLASADDDVRNAAQLLGREAVNNRSTGPLRIMTDWAPGQIDKLQSITDSIPAGSLHDRVAKSTDLVRRALARAEALRAAINAGCVAKARTDALGPVPPATCTNGGQGKTSAPSTQPNSVPSSANAPTGAGNATQNGPGTPRLSPTASAPNSGATTSAPHVAINSCGVTASIGPIGVNLGSCGVSVGVTSSP